MHGHACGCVLSALSPCEQTKNCFFIAPETRALHFVPDASLIQVEGVYLSYIHRICKAEVSCCLLELSKPASGEGHMNCPGGWWASEQRVDLVCICLHVPAADRLPRLPLVPL